MNPANTVVPPTNEKKLSWVEENAWNEFRESGLLWWVNRSLHLFGWAICMVTDEEGNFLKGYPCRVGYRGFPPDREENGFKTLTAYLAREAESLTQDTK